METRATVRVSGSKSSGQSQWKQETRGRTESDAEKKRRIREQNQGTKYENEVRGAEQKSRVSDAAQTEEQAEQT